MSGISSMNNNVYVQKGNEFFKTENGKLKKISKEEYDRGVFATQITTQAKGPDAATQIKGLNSPDALVQTKNSNIMGLQQQHANPDAGAGSGANITTSHSTTVTLPNLEPAFIAQLQQHGLIGSGSPDGKYEVKPDMLDKLMQALEDYNNVPENMNEIEITGDAKPRIEAQLKEQGVIDEQGNIIDKTKFGEIARNGITLGDKTFKFAQEDDGKTKIDVTTQTQTTVSSKFKEFDPAALQRMQKQGDLKGQMKELQKMGQVVIIDGRYYTSNPGLQRKDAAAPTTATSNVDPTSLVGNTTAQDAREKQLQEVFLTAYDTNPENAQDTLMHTKYYKEYTKLEEALRNLDSKDIPNSKDKDYGNEVAYKRKGVLARAYYAESRTIDGKVTHEYATPEEVKAMQDTIKKNYENLKAEQEKLLASNPNDRTMADKYIKYFSPENSKHITKLDEKQLLELAEAQAYETGLTDTQIKHMASTQFKNRFNTQMSNVYHEYQAKIEEAQKKGDSEKVAKLNEECQKKLKEISNKKIETENQDRADYAKMMARGQLNSEIGEGNFKQTQPTYNSIIAKCPKAAQFIEANKQLFFKDGQFDPQSWKDFWKEQASSRVDNKQQGHEFIEDYFLTLGEAEDITKGNKNGSQNEDFVGLGQIFGKDMSKNAMVDLARDMAESAGIVTEKNNTAGIRTGYVFGGIGKGVAGAAAADLLGNFVLSKLHIKYGELVTGTVTGTVDGTVKFARSGTVQGMDKFVSEFYDNGVKVGEQITERVTEHPWSVEGEEPFSKEYSQDYAKEVKGEKGLGKFHLDPLALAIGGVAGGIERLIKMHKKHDKEDKNSEVQMYSRRDYNERATSSVTNDTATREIANKRYVANVEVGEKTEPKKIENLAHKITIKRGQGTMLYHGQRVPYNEAEDKRSLVSQIYNVPVSDPRFEALFKYVMEDINGVKQYADHQYKNDKTYHFPEELPASITGLGEDFKMEKKPEETEKHWIKIPLANGVKTNIGGSPKELPPVPGQDTTANGTIRAKKRR